MRAFWLFNDHYASEHYNLWSFYSSLRFWEFEQTRCFEYMCLSEIIGPTLSSRAVGNNGSVGRGRDHGDGRRNAGGGDNSRL